MLNTARIAGIFAFASAASFAGADVVAFDGLVPASAEQTGATFSVSLEYSAQTESAGDLVITLRNDSPAQVGGYLTGFVFNIDSADEGSGAAYLGGTDADFVATGPTSAQPFGLFDAGVALGGNWEGGGDPKKGLAPGQSASFSFDVSASDADMLSASSFASGPNPYDLVVRFRGLAGGGSDKVPVPTPASTALVALGGLFAARRKRA